jgi:prepilin-type N-terminal cleavage/methylation domain-containing protein
VNSGLSRCGRRGGFTLIETLVAFAILALTLAALLRVFSTGLDSIGLAERYAAATMLARSILDETGADIPLVADELSRDAGDGFIWNVKIARSAVIAPIVDTDLWLVPYDVAVTVTWEGGGSLTLTTLHLASEPAPALEGGDAGQ